MVIKQDVLLRSWFSKVVLRIEPDFRTCESQLDRLAGWQDEGWTPRARIKNWLTLVRAGPPKNAPAGSAEVNRPEGAHVSGDVVDSAILVSIVIDPDPRKAAVGGAEESPLPADGADDEESQFGRAGCSLSVAQRSRFLDASDQGQLR